MLKRIIGHWSAGTHAVSRLDRQHYHYIVSGSGIVSEGDHDPAANISPKAGRYAAHTLNCNTGSIGVAMAAMAQAAERPFNPGPWPITPAQLAAYVGLVARLCRQYGIPVTRETVLTHAEVQPTLGIVQRGKWDVSWLPGMEKPGDPVEVGDRIRAMVRAELATTGDEVRPELKTGDVGPAVREVQTALKSAGHNPGDIDGKFGAKTRQATLSFQRARGLSAVGTINAATWAALLKG